MTSTTRTRSRTPRQASPAQTRYLRVLIGERTQDALAPFAEEIETALHGGLMAPDLIDRVIAIPRLPRGTAGTPSSSRTTVTANEDEYTWIPQPDNRAGRMLLAGGIEATVTVASGEHVTIRIRTRVQNGTSTGWRNCAPGDPGARTTIKILDRKVGWINVEGAAAAWKLTLRTRNTEYIAAIRALFESAAGVTPAYRVQVADRCGRCFRTLTDPVSIDRGVGPECYGQGTGSQHARWGASEQFAAAHETAQRNRPTARVSFENIDIDVPSLTETSPLTPFPLTSRALESREAQIQEDAYNAAVQRAERAEDERAARLEMEEERALGIGDYTVRDEEMNPRREPSLSYDPPVRRPLNELAASLTARPTTDVERARGLIAEALDAYFDDSPEAARALATFDRLAREAQA
jgi:hypothetical protein